MIGIGLGIGLSAPPRMTAAALASGLASIFGSKLDTLLIGEDCVFAAGALTAWPARIGTNPTVLGTFAQSTVGGRLAATNTGTTRGCLHKSSTADSVWAVTDSPDSFSGYRTLTRLDDGGGEVLTTAGGAATTWFWPLVPYRNGVKSSSALSVGPAVFEGTFANGATPIVSFAGSRTFDDRDWLAPVALFMLLASEATAEQRAAGLDIIARYYRIVR